MAVEEAGLPAEIVVFTSGMKAIEYLILKAAMKRPLILLDLNLPMMSGLEVLEAIRSNDAFASLPVIVLSGSRDQAVVDRCYRTGANSFISRPADWDALVSLVKSLVTYWSMVKLPQFPPFQRKSIRPASSFRMLSDKRIIA